MNDRKLQEAKRTYTHFMNNYRSCRSAKDFLKMETFGLGPIGSPEVWEKEKSL